MPLRQTAIIRDRLIAAHPELAAAGAVEIVTIRTTGDRVQDRLLPEIGGKGLFAKEIEEALLAGHVDLAVHSETCCQSGSVQKQKRDCQNHAAFPPCGRQRGATNSAYTPAICNPLYKSCKVAAKLWGGLGSSLANQSWIFSSGQSLNFSRYSFTAVCASFCSSRSARA
jgi:Porphobilinogen deaminase, dipyromethane cofactor binding domain